MARIFFFAESWRNRESFSKLLSFSSSGSWVSTFSISSGTMSLPLHFRLKPLWRKKVVISYCFANAVELINEMKAEELMWILFLL